MWHGCRIKTFKTYLDLGRFYESDAGLFIRRHISPNGINTYARMK